MKRHLSPQTAGHTAGAGVGGQTTGGLEGQGVPLQGSASRTFPQVHGGGVLGVGDRDQPCPHSRGSMSLEVTIKLSWLHLEADLK